MKGERDGGDGRRFNQSVETSAITYKKKIVYGALDRLVPEASLKKRPLSRDLTDARQQGW